MGLAVVATCPQGAAALPVPQVEDREARASLELEPWGLGAILGPLSSCKMARGLISSSEAGERNNRASPGAGAQPGQCPGHLGLLILLPAVELMGAFQGKRIGIKCACT